MSARSSSRRQPDQYRTMRGVAVVAALLTGCFLFGFIVLSPLINRATASPQQSAPQPTARQETPPAQNAPAVQPEAAPQQPPQAPVQKQGLTVQPGITVAPDRSSEVQRGDAVDQNAARTDVLSGVEPTEAERSRDSGARTDDAATATEQPRRRRRARREDNGETSTPRRRTTDEDATARTQRGEVQKGESIDPDR